jgi:hypothetical protein
MILPGDAHGMAPPLLEQPRASVSPGEAPMQASPVPADPPLPPPVWNDRIGKERPHPRLTPASHTCLQHNNRCPPARLPRIWNYARSNRKIVCQSESDLGEFIEQNFWGPEITLRLNVAKLKRPKWLSNEVFQARNWNIRVTYVPNRSRPQIVALAADNPVNNQGGTPLSVVSIRCMANQYLSCRQVRSECPEANWEQLGEFTGPNWQILARNWLWSCLQWPQLLGLVCGLCG